jgi:hypothetical protein
MGRCKSRQAQDAKRQNKLQHPQACNLSNRLDPPSLLRT